MILVLTHDVEIAHTIAESIGNAVPVTATPHTGDFLAYTSRPAAPLTAIVVDYRSAREQDLIVRIHRTVPLVPSIAIVEGSDFDLAVELAQHGVSACIPAPLQRDDLRERFHRAVTTAARALPPGREAAGAEQALPAPSAALRELVGQSAPMRDLRAIVQQCAQSPEPVIIIGETGTGKEVIARALHASSPRSDGPFVAVNVNALPEQLFESELFGSVRGAYTGAIDRPGLFQSAEGGTLFLDEIGDLPAHLQTRLLRVLEDRSVRPVGGSATIRVDVRLVLATHRNVFDLVKRKIFREDLWYRISSLIVPVPALRDRIDDLPLLVRALLDREGLDRVRLSPAAINRLRDHSWPGNVRELRAVLIRSALMSQRAVLRASDIIFDQTLFEHLFPPELAALREDE